MIMFVKKSEETSLSKSQITLLCGAVLLLGLVDFGVIVHYMSMPRPSNLFPETIQMCVACDQFPAGSGSADLISSLSRKVKNGSETCCIESLEKLTVMIELIRQKHSSIQGSKHDNYAISERSESAPSHASAHKRLLPDHLSPGFSDLSNQTNVRLRLNSFDNDPLKEHASNVVVLPSGYLILVTGFYHVYSSIDFTPRRSKPCREYEMKTWRQGVVRSRANHRQDSGHLLISAHTCCDDCIWDKETSYTGGTFFLQAGDHLHVEVSGMELVSFHKESSFFGLAMLTDGNIQLNQST